MNEVYLKELSERLLRIEQIQQKILLKLEKIEEKGDIINNNLAILQDNILRGR
jgi:hypothetical protein